MDKRVSRVSHQLHNFDTFNSGQLADSHANFPSCGRCCPMHTAPIVSNVMREHKNASRLRRGFSMCFFFFFFLLCFHSHFLLLFVPFVYFRPDRKQTETDGIKIKTLLAPKFSMATFMCRMRKRSVGKSNFTRSPCPSHRHSRRCDRSKRAGGRVNATADRRRYINRWCVHTVLDGFAAFCRRFVFASVRRPSHRSATDKCSTYFLALQNRNHI